MSTATWLTTFGIDKADRGSRLFVATDDTHGAPFGHAMAQGLEAGVTGYLAHQGKPLAAFVYLEDEKATAEIANLHDLWAVLWNQGLASVLVFHCPGKVEVYSLTPKLDDLTQNNLTPVEALGVAEVGLTAFVGRCRDFIWELEDGLYYQRNQDRFSTEARVDRRLLANMQEASSQLINSGLSAAQARALLLQTLFIAYLEDREILQKSDFVGCTGYSSLKGILDRGDVDAFRALFKDLAGKFNGDVFSSPCSFDGNEALHLEPAHLEPLLAFRSAKSDMATSQLWLLSMYDFKFIPVELLSAIYDRFQQPETQRDTGSYFTPAYLAQACLDMAWKYISAEQKGAPDFKVLDPACGSAVFLVCAFQRLVGLAQAASGDVSWDKLRSILEQIHGIDANGDALRVGIISLYIALLERSDPPSITKQFEIGRILPPLLGKTMRIADFFDDEDSGAKYDLIIGNPPWVSRNQATAKMASWCKAHRYPSPGKSTVWGFLWKSGMKLKDGGVAAFLVDAKILFNLQGVKALEKLFAEYRIPLIVNLADACFQLFEEAEAPAALCVLQRRQDDGPRRFEETEYWSPKANPVFSANNRIVLSPDDRSVFKQWRLRSDTSLLKHRRWGRSRDIFLMNALERFPTLEEYMGEYKIWKSKNHPDKPWWIGQGFTTSTSEKTPVTVTMPELYGSPYITTNDIDQFQWTLPCWETLWVGETKLHFSRIVKELVQTKEFSPPIILLKQGVDRSTGLLRAVYTEQAVSFKHSIQAIISTRGKNDADLFKILTAVLNSKLAAWFYLHTSTMQGVERAKVLQKDILALPFPLPEESEDIAAGKEIVAFFDKLAAAHETQQNSTLHYILFGPKNEGLINELVYRYYGLTETERQVVEDTYDYILPSLQPRSLRRQTARKKFPPLWETPARPMLEGYAKFFHKGMAANYDPTPNLYVTIFNGHSGLILMELVRDEADGFHVEEAESELLHRLDYLEQNWPGKLASGVHQLLNVVFAHGNKIFLVKPNRTRHWMPSSALCDVDRIVADLTVVRLGA